MSQLAPNENYPIFFGLINHTDTNTYYVQTKIYDSNHKLIDTVNLTDQGSQNFLKMWKVPYDNVFQRGKWILMVTSVYTDSNYTSKSPNYGDEFQTHLVQERWDMAKVASIGGGSEVDYKKIKKLIKDELKEMKPKEVKEIDVEKLTKNITKNVVNAIPKPEKIEIPQPKEVNLKPLEQKVEKVSETVKKETSLIKKDLRDKIENNGTMLVSKVENESSYVRTTLENFFEALKQTIAKHQVTLDIKMPEQKQSLSERDILIKNLRKKHSL